MFYGIEGQRGSMGTQRGLRRPIPVESIPDLVPLRLTQLAREAGIRNCF
jgi:hypothetical protein